MLRLSSFVIRVSIVALWNPSCTITLNNFANALLSGVHVFHRTKITASSRRKEQFSLPSPLFGLKQINVENDNKFQKKEICEEIGSGSYGTVHCLTQTSSSNNETTQYVGKRPWKTEDLLELDSTIQNPNQRAKRCMHYWQVEKHCFEKLTPHPQLPSYKGTHCENNGKTTSWMLFEYIGDTENNQNKPAPSLQDLIQTDVQAEEASQLLSLQTVAKAMQCQSYTEALDKLFASLFTILTHVHNHQIVHRDVKPGNLLIHNGKVILIDFGSAADLQPFGLFQTRKGLEDGNTVAVSPMYCAPEMYIDPFYHPQAFDVFSTALLMCQLIFAMLEERIDAGFHQQLKESQWDLNLWLNKQVVNSKLRPLGLEDGLEYLNERRGLWRLLGEMLSERPEKRPKMKDALDRLNKILNKNNDDHYYMDNKHQDDDEPFFKMVMESFETCELPNNEDQPYLRFVATFDRKQSLGLVLSEKEDMQDQEEEEVDPLWMEGTKDAVEGQVFVKEILEGGQADKLGILQIGDRLQGIGDLTFLGGGFERAVEMLQDQPEKTKNVKLHFDRLISLKSNKEIGQTIVPSNEVDMKIQDFGAWSALGRRTAQEDAFVLHEIHNTQNQSILLAGVMDGHGGTAASEAVSANLPTFTSDHLLLNSPSLRPSVAEALTNAWQAVCDNYRNECGEDSEACVADYDPKYGELNANTGSTKLIAGTTASIMAYDEETKQVTFLNCGDSRSILADSFGKVKYVTKDHTPQTEEQRLSKGLKNGKPYSQLQCRLSKWFLTIGEYEYAVGRSLEGPYVTSHGIVSDPDVMTISVPNQTGDGGAILLSATDGLFEVLDTNLVARNLSEMRWGRGMTAKETAKALCNEALERGTYDNVSVVVVFL